MRILSVLIIALVMTTLGYAAYPPVTPKPFPSMTANILMTPYCLSSNPASSVGGFMQNASSGISGNTLTVTDGVNTYAATINTTTGAMTCFIKQ